MSAPTKCAPNKNKKNQKNKNKSTSSQQFVPIVTCQTLGSGIKKKPVRKRKAKQYLKAPFKYEWPITSERDSVNIVNILKESFKAEGLQRELCTRGGKKVREKGTQSIVSTDGTENKEANEKWNYLVFGINAVTRAIEKGQAHLVLCDSAAYPSLLTLHLIELCRHNNVPAASISGLSSVGEVTGLRSLTALAFRELDQIQNENLCTTISTIITMIPKIESPLEVKETVPALDHPLIEDAIHVSMEQSSTNKIKMPADDVDFASLYVFKKDLQFNKQEDFISLSSAFKRKSDKEIDSYPGKKLRYVPAQTGETKYNPDRPNRSKKVKCKELKRMME